MSRSSLAPQLQPASLVALTGRESAPAPAANEDGAPLAPRGLDEDTEARLRAEIERLGDLVEQAQRDKLTSLEIEQLLQSVIDQLPVALTVQDENGRFILANTPAAASVSVPLSRLVGSSPADFLPEDEARARREWEERVIGERRSVTFEDSAAGPLGASTWSTSFKPITVSGRTLLMSSSVDITHHKQLENELQKRANFDDLTGLPKRGLIKQYIELIIAGDDGTRQFALAFIDLDNFKHVNDYYSHSVGDALLINIGKRVTNCLRPGDMLARISGDEFLLLLDPYESREQISDVIDRIMQSIRQPFQIDVFEVYGTCSAGVSIYPEHGGNFEELRRNADSAMYRAKQRAKGGAVYFNHGIAQAMHDRVQAEQRLRFAIQDRKFCCAFQPKVDIYSRDVIGFETLVRWRDDDGEIHPPAKFIALAIELGLIDPITQFVFSEALELMDRLDAAFGAGTAISVNLATKQANDAAFMSSIIGTLEKSGRPERIIIELTEDAFIPKGVFQTQVLPQLRRIGTRVSIDDFGTGYSSLGVLADITADELKIDRSFISNIQERPRSQSILRAIESLGTTLGMTIIAEGVETEEELAYLQATTNIQFVQGFYFSKPFYLEGLTAFRNRHRSGEPVRASDRRGSSSSRVAVPSRLTV